MTNVACDWYAATVMLINVTVINVLLGIHGSRPIQSFEYEDVLPKLGEYLTEWFLISVILLLHTDSGIKYVAPLYAM